MNLIDNLSKTELSDLLNKCWMTHDGMWFYSCLQESGIEMANKLNKLAMKSLASIELSRFKNAFGIKGEKIENFDEFKNFFLSISGILTPEFMNIRWFFTEGKYLHWEFNENRCFAFNGISRLGVIDQYECGPIYRIKCWLKDLGIKYEVLPEIDKCISPEDGICSGKIRLIF